MGAGHDHGHGGDVRVGRMLAGAAILATFFVVELTTALLIIGWVVVAFRSDLLNNWFWPAAVSGILLAGSTFLYNVIRG